MRRTVSFILYVSATVIKLSAIPVAFVMNSYSSCKKKKTTFLQTPIYFQEMADFIPVALLDKKSFTADEISFFSDHLNDPQHPRNLSSSVCYSCSILRAMGSPSLLQLG